MKESAWTKPTSTGASSLPGERYTSRNWSRAGRRWNSQRNQYFGARATFQGLRETCHTSSLPGAEAQLVKPGLPPVMLRSSGEGIWIFFVQRMTESCWGVIKKLLELRQRTRQGCLVIYPWRKRVIKYFTFIKSDCSASTTTLSCHGSWPMLFLPEACRMQIVCVHLYLTAK